MAKADKNMFTITDVSKQVSLNVRRNREIHVMNDQRIYNKNKISVPYSCLWYLQSLSDNERR